ncbi:MAG: HAMP domain-containing histidine kinase [Lachnospiraceae bacterium]|nr:HAMP domain-containing histidine kinase [Lachnospiraceae bacterium]
MKFKTRLQITFLTIIILPVLLAVIAFVIIGKVLFVRHPGFDHIPQGVGQMEYLFTEGMAKPLFMYMAISIVGILVVTGILLTIWIARSIFDPIHQLNVAMQNIAEGNLEYMLESNNTGEIGTLYKNYEEMRLRLKESADEKLLAESQNRELVSNITHDLKTPITSIKGYVEGIMDGVADTPEKMDKYIKTIYNKANDMDKLINELTVYSGIDNNRVPYHFLRLNIADYFGDCIEEVGLDLESKNIKLDYSNLTSPDTQIIADPEQLKRVINNIISNSVKYIDRTREPQIDIRILDENDAIRIEIEDNGRGISQRDLPNIFERFYRTDSSRNSSRGGSGIGLSIVKKIVEDHGGYIWATSRENEGTCMHMVFRKYEVSENAREEVYEQ